MFFAPDCSGRSVEGGRWLTFLYDIDHNFDQVDNNEIYDNFERDDSNKNDGEHDADAG